MVARKRTVKTKTEESEKTPAVVTQIVEVIEVLESPQEEINLTKPRSEEEVKPEEKNPSELEEVASPEEEKAPEEPKEKKEETDVLSDLFTKEESAVMPEITMHTSRSSRTIIMWATALITAAVLVSIALVVSKGNFSIEIPSFSASPTPTQTPAPSPTPEPVVKENLKIQVLNGGGVAGAAGKMKAFLEENGYTVADLGNTDDYSFEKTVVLVKSGKEAALTLLTKDLKDEYSLEDSTKTLPSDSPYDAQVIVGKE